MVRDNFNVCVSIGLTLIDTDGFTRTSKSFIVEVGVNVWSNDIDSVHQQLMNAICKNVVDLDYTKDWFDIQMDARINFSNIHDNTFHVGYDLINLTFNHSRVRETTYRSRSKFSVSNSRVITQSHNPDLFAMHTNMSSPLQVAIDDIISRSSMVISMMRYTNSVVM